MLISVGQLSNVCAARKGRAISFLALRVWLAAHELKAKRCIAQRKLFTVSELATLIREREGSVKRALSEITSRGLIAWSEREISFPRTISPEGEEIASDFGTSPQRPVPVPRRVLRAIFRHTRPAEVLAALGHLIRCLFLKAGKIYNGGLVRASSLAFILGIAERSVHSARTWLIAAGHLAQETVHQLVMNRFGGKFSFSLVAVTATSRSRAQRFAPPSKTKSTYRSTSNNQINNKPALAVSGVHGEHSRLPTLRNIQPEDLRRPERLEMLYRQAVNAKWIQPCEASIRNFASAALRATRAGGRVGAIFVGIVKNRLWHYITLEQEDRALCVLRRFRQRCPDAFRINKCGTSEDGLERSAALTELLTSARTRTLKGNGAGESEHSTRQRLRAQLDSIAKADSRSANCTPMRRLTHFTQPSLAKSTPG